MIIETLRYYKIRILWIEYVKINLTLCYCQIQNIIVDLRNVSQHNVYEASG